MCRGFLRVGVRSREYPFRLAASRQATFPKGTALVVAGNFVADAERLPLGGAGCERSEQTEGVSRRVLNSLSQSLTALPAPSGREPLAKPEALQLSRELSRYAKGPILEGAVAVGDWGSSLPANAAAFFTFYGVVC